jgi:hypothetical protein
MTIVTKGREFRAEVLFRTQEDATKKLEEILYAIKEKGGKFNKPI